MERVPCSNYDMPSLLEHQLVSFCFILLMCLLSASTCWLFPSWYFIDSNLIEEQPLTNMDLFQKFDMFLWTSGFQNPLIDTDFDKFVDE